jgi:hypothetical protein
MSPFISKVDRPNIERDKIHHAIYLHTVPYDRYDTTGCIPLYLDTIGTYPNGQKIYPYQSSVANRSFHKSRLGSGS